MQKTIDQERMTFDDFDFAVFTTPRGGKDSDDDRCHNYPPEFAMTRQSRLAWERILDKWDRYRVGVRQDKVRKLILRGIDPSVRSDLWRKMLDISGLEASASFSYEMHIQQLRQEMVTLGVTEYNIERTEHYLSNLIPEELTASPLNVVALRQILLDVGRSYPTHRKFMPNTADGVEGQAALFRVLAVYSIYNPLINYCQGMSYLGGILLMKLEEKEAFWALVSLMERRKYLCGHYTNRLERIQGFGKVFRKVLERKLPDLSKHLEDLGIDPLLYLPKWILSMFTNLPCWDSVLMVWDLFLLDGSIVIFQTSLAIMTLSAPDLLKLDDINLVIPYLQRIPHEIANRERLSLTIERIRFESWEILCIQTLVHEESTRCPCCGRDALHNCRCRQQRKNRRSGSVFKKMLRTLTRQQKVAVPSPTVSVISDSDSSFEVVRSASRCAQSVVWHNCHPDDVTFYSPATAVVQTPKSRKGRGLRKLVGGSADLQMVFRQFQMPSSRRTSSVVQTQTFHNAGAIPSPLELYSVNPNVTVRRLQSSVNAQSTRSPPSPVEMDWITRHSTLTPRSNGSPSSLVEMNGILKNFTPNNSPLSTSRISRENTSTPTGLQYSRSPVTFALQRISSTDSRCAFSPIQPVRRSQEQKNDSVVLPDSKKSRLSNPYNKHNGRDSKNAFLRVPNEFSKENTKSNEAENLEPSKGCKKRKSFSPELIFSLGGRKPLQNLNLTT